MRDQMLRRLLIGTLTALLAAACGSAVHYWTEVRKARADTSALVQEAFQKYGRHVTLKDLPPERIAMLLKIEDPMFRRHRGVDLVTTGAGMTTIKQRMVEVVSFPCGFHE